MAQEQQVNVSSDDLLLLLGRKDVELSVKESQVEGLLEANGKMYMENQVLRARLEIGSEDEIEGLQGEFEKISRPEVPSNGAKKVTRPKARKK